MIQNMDGLAQARETAKKNLEAQACRILICAGTGCLAGGSEKIYQELCALAEGISGVQIEFGEGVACGDLHTDVRKSGCHGFCEMGPLVRIEPMGLLYTRVSPDDCEEIFNRTVCGGEVIERLL